MLKRLLKSILLAFLALSLFSGVAWAAWDYLFPIIIVDTSNTTRTYYPVLLGFGGQSLIDTGQISSSGNDTNMQIGSANIIYMMATGNVTAVIPSLPSGGVVTANLYTGYTPEQSVFAIITGDGGYVTVADSATLEPSDNFSLSLAGHINTDNGTNKYFVNKQNAFSVYVSSTVSGNITGGIEEAQTNKINYEAGDDVGIQVHGASWEAQTFTTTSPFRVTQVQVYGYDNGALGTLTLAVYDTAAGEPDSLLTSGNISGGDIPGVNGWISVNVTGYDLAASTQYALVASVDTASPNSLMWRNDSTAPTFANGARVFSGDSGVNWTIDVTRDFLFRILGGAFLLVSTSGVSSGEHEVIIAADSTNLTLSIDGVLEDSMALGGNSVLNNSNNWTFCENDVMSYADNITFSIGGTQQLYLAPNTMISGTNIPDRSGNSHNGTITWGSNSGISLSYGEMSSFEDFLATANITGGFSIPEASMPATWFAAGENVASLPFYDSISEVAAQTGKPVQVYYFVAIVGVAFGAFLGIVVFTRSALMAYIALVIVFAIGASMTIIPAWIVFVLLIVGVAIMFLYRQVAY